MVLHTANGLGAIVAGPLGDRLGHGRLLVAGLGLHVASLLAIVATHGLRGFYVALILSGVATVAASISSANVTVSFANRGEKGNFVAVTQLVTYPATALSTALGGLLIDRVGFEALFLTSTFFPLAAIVLMLRVRAMTRRPSSGVGYADGA